MQRANTQGGAADKVRRQEGKKATDTNQQQLKATGGKRAAQLNNCAGGIHSSNRAWLEVQRTRSKPAKSMFELSGLAFERAIERKTKIMHNWTEKMYKF